MAGEAHKQSPARLLCEALQSLSCLRLIALAADFDVTAPIHYHFHFVTTAGPGVRGNLATQQAISPANGGWLGAATGHTHSDRGVAAATGWIDT